MTQFGGKFVTIKIDGELYYKIDYNDKWLCVSYDYIRDEKGNVMQLTFDEAKKYNPPTKEQYRYLIPIRRSFDVRVMEHYRNEINCNRLGEEWTSSELNDMYAYYFRRMPNEESCGMYTNAKGYRMPCRKTRIVNKKQR